MIQSTNPFISDVKNTVKNIKNVLGFLIGTSVCLSVVYFAYWILAMTDDSILIYTQNVFNPIANLISPNNTSVEIYKTASFVLFSLVVPFGILSYVCDKVEEYIIDKHNELEELKDKKAKLQEYKNYIKQFDEIKSFSICLSLDYKSKRELTSQTKETLNKIIYSQFKNVFKELIPQANVVSTNEVLVITSDNFNKYDYIYSSTLKILAKIKDHADVKYDVETIPSLTTDAYKKSVEVENIKKNHFEIQSFNFKNRACSTALFSKKYQHLKQNKYVGIPIGEYTSIDKNKPATYELNMVNKNLTQTLASYK